MELFQCSILISMGNARGAAKWFSFPLLFQLKSSVHQRVFLLTNVLNRGLDSSPKRLLDGDGHIGIVVVSSDHHVGFVFIGRVDEVSGSGRGAVNQFGCIFTLHEVTQHWTPYRAGQADAGVSSKSLRDRESIGVMQRNKHQERFRVES